MSLSAYERDRQHFVHDVRHETMLLDRYAQAEPLLRAVAAGDEKTAWECIRGALQNIYEVDRQYTPEEATLRQARYRLISLKTAFSICAGYARVHPIYMHTLSRRYDKQIDRLCSPEQEQELHRQMLHSYCDLIRLARSRHYGAFSDEVIQSLLSDLTAPPALSEIARQVGVSPATVSRRFKAETGQTLPEFVNRSRVQLAKLYLQEDAPNLSAVAQSLGFSDASYFSKVFSRYAGMTPTEYLLSSQQPVHSAKA